MDAHLALFNIEESIRAKARDYKWASDKTKFPLWETNLAVSIALENVADAIGHELKCISNASTE